jgi:hypothetical protein
MSRDQRVESLQALKRLNDAAEEFVNHTPRLKRTETERQALLDAITGAQLVLSVHRLPSQGETQRIPARSSVEQKRKRR